MKISFNAGYRAFENQAIAYKRGISVSLILVKKRVYHANHTLSN